MLIGVESLQANVLPSYGFPFHFLNREKPKKIV